MILFRIGVAALPLLAGLTPLTARADTIRTKAPQAHIDAFISSCHADNVPNAICACMVKRLSETREGDAALDAMGLMSLTKDKAARSAAFTPLLNRHGMRPSELQKAVDPAGPLISGLAQQCN